MQKNGLIRKISLISKFMTSQCGKQTIAISVEVKESGDEIWSVTAI